MATLYSYVTGQYITVNDPAQAQVMIEKEGWREVPGMVTTAEPRYYRKGTEIKTEQFTGPTSTPSATLTTPEEYYNYYDARWKSLGYQPITAQEYQAYQQGLSSLGIPMQAKPDASTLQALEQYVQNNPAPVPAAGSNIPAPDMVSGALATAPAPVAAGGTGSPPSGGTASTSTASPVDTLLGYSAQPAPVQANPIPPEVAAAINDYGATTVMPPAASVPMAGATATGAVTQPTATAPIEETNVMQPVDAVIQAISEQIAAQQPTEAELLAQAHTRYDPYFAQQQALMEEYYDMQRRQAQAAYSRVASYVGAAQSALQKEYAIYKEQLETGKLRAGSDEQKIIARTLEDKTRALDQLKADQQAKLQNLLKSYISRGGLFSGARLGAERLAGEQYQRDITGVETSANRTVGDAQTQYQRALEDYAYEGKSRQASMEKEQASLSSQSAGAASSMQAAMEEANYAQKVKTMDLQEQQQEALMKYVYGENAYKYLGL